MQIIADVAITILTHGTDFSLSGSQLAHLTALTEASPTPVPPPPEPLLLHEITGWIRSIAGSYLVLPALMFFCFIDAIIPPLPSESLIIGLSSWSFSQPAAEVVPLPLVFLFAVAGGILGDSFTYWLGTKIPIEKIAFLNRGKGRKIYDLAAHTLRRRGTSFIFCARFIPAGRIAVNACAGATNFGWKRFARTDIAAVICWVGYGLLIGMVSGKVVGHLHSLLAVGVGIIGGLLMSLVLDRIVNLIQRKYWEPPTSTPETAAAVQNQEPTSTGEPQDATPDSTAEPPSTGA